MVFGWRKAFCTSVPQEANSTTKATDHATPKSGGRFVFFSSSSSNPSTPRLPPQPDSCPNPNLRCRTTSNPELSASVPVSPKLHCKTSRKTKLFQWSSTPSSPRSPSTFSLLKSNIRLSTNRCGLCSESVKRGRGVAIFTAECSHSFHFPCIAGYVKAKGSLICPICSNMKKETPVLSVVSDCDQKQQIIAEKVIEDVVVNKKKSELRKLHSFRPDLKVYNDDEPLGSLTPKARFNPIPESDENDDEDSIVEFQGFHSNSNGNSNSNSNSNSPVNIHSRDMDVKLLAESAVISTGRGYETCAVVLRAKAPPMRAKSQGRAPIDLVAVVDVSDKMSNEKIQLMKRTMRMIISSLSSSDRLSIVAFSSYSKRLLALKRMTSTGKRAARRIVEAMAVLEGCSNANDAVKKAAKVIEDRVERNTAASIFLLSDVSDQSSYISSTRYLNVAVHTLKLTAIDDLQFAKCVSSLLNVTVQDLKLELGFVSGSAPAEIVSVYSHAPRAVALGSGTVRLGEMCANEERDLLIELKVPSSSVGANQVLSIRCSYKESVTQHVIYCNEHALVVPRPQAVRSSSMTIQRLRKLFITTRALAESRQLAARNDLTGAYHMLISARAILHQTSSVYSEFVVSLDAELNELQRRRNVPAQAERGRVGTAACFDEKGEPLTPISAWRVAEKLAKVAMMRKTLNRVSDLHGFEDARF